VLFSKVGSDLVSGIQTQLLEHVAHVGGNCVLGEREMRGDLAVGEAAGDETSYLLPTPQDAQPPHAWDPPPAPHSTRHAGFGGSLSPATPDARAEKVMAVVGRPRRAWPRPPLAGLREALRSGAYLPLPQTDFGVDHPASASSGAGRPLELADLGCLRAATPGTSVRCWSTAPLGAPLRCGSADTVPGS